MRTNRIGPANHSYATVLFFMVLAFLAWLVVNIFYGERIPVNQGIGYDGVAYAMFAKSLPTFLFQHLISDYMIQRIFPSTIIYFFSTLLHSSPTDQQLPMFFSIYNTGILIIALMTWHAIANELRWSREVRLISFAGLFFNYAILKMNTYDPVLTDTTAFVLGMMLAYFYLANKRIPLLMTTLVGAFSFPTLLYVGLMLFIFPRFQKREFRQPFYRSSMLSALLIAFLSACAIVTIVYLVYAPIGLREDFVLSSNKKLFKFSVTTLCFYFTLALFPLFYRYQPFFVKIVKQVFSLRTLIALSILIGVRAIIHHTAPIASVTTPWLFMQYVAIRSLAFPFIYLISHFVYYGPIVCLLIYFWNDMIQYFKDHFPGLVAVAIFYVALSIDSESRQIINFLPVVVVGVCEILNRKKLSPLFTYTFVFLSFAISRVWLPLNHGPWPSMETEPPQLTLVSPMQWYFMNFGPWMSRPIYVLFFALICITFVLLHTLAKRGVQPLSGRLN